MADFVWVGDISSDWNDIGNWRDGATGAPVVALPGVADDVHFGEWIGGGAPWGQSAFIGPAGVSVNNVYFYGAGSGGFAPYLAELDAIRSFTLDLQGTLTCEEIYCLGGSYANPRGNAGGDPAALTFTGPSGVSATSRLHIDGGTYSNLGTLSGGDVSIKGTVINPDLTTSTVLVSGALGISAEALNIATLTFTGPSSLAYNSVLTPHDFNEIIITNLNINANVTGSGNAATPANEHMFIVDTCSIDSAVTHNACRVKPTTLNLAHGLVFTQNSNNRYGKLVVASGAVVMSSQGFTGYGDLELQTGGSLTLNTSVACEIGRFVGPGYTASTLYIGDITSNGGDSGEFLFDILDYPHHSTIDITIDNSVGSHSPSSIDVIFRTGTGAVELMRLNSFSVIGATTVNVTAESSASSVTIGQGTLTGQAVTAESFTFQSGAVGFTNALNIRPGASTTTIYDAQTALTTTSGVVTLYPYALPFGSSTYSYTINGNITSHTVGAFPFVVDLSGGFENYSIACNSTSFSSFTSTVSNSFTAKTLTFTYTNSCFIGDLIITGGAAASSTYHSKFIHQTGTASTDRISLFSGSGITVPSHGATRLQTQGEGQLWFRNAGDTDFNSVTLESGSQANETNNSIRLASTTSRAISSANTFIFESGAEFILAAGMTTNCSIETRLNQPTAPALSSEYHFYCDDAAVITFEDGTSQEDFYINPNIISGNHMGIRYPLPANAPYVPAYAPDGPSTLHINSSAQQVYGALIYPASYDHTISAGYLYSRHKGYSGDTRKTLDLRGTISPDVTFYANMDSTATGTSGEVRFDNAVADSPGLYLTCQSSRTINVEFTGSFEIPYLRFGGALCTYVMNNTAGLDSILTLDTYGFDSRGSFKMTWDDTIDLDIVDCDVNVQNTLGWENTVNVRVLSGTCEYTFPHSIISAYKDCPIITIDAGAQLHPTATGQAAHSLTGPGTFNWRGLVAAPSDVEFYLVVLGGNLDASVVYDQEDANCHLKIIAYATPATQPVLLAGSYNSQVYIGYATGTTTTGDLIATSTIATNFYKGLHLNYNQMTPTVATHIAGGFTKTTVIVRVESILNVYEYGQLGGGSQTNVVNASGVIEYTASHDAVKAANTINVIATTTNCVFTGLGYWVAQEVTIAGGANTYLVELTNIRAHDGSTGDFYVGQYSNDTMAPVSATWHNAYVNHVTIGDDSIIHRRSGTQIPRSQFVGTMTRSHVYTDKNETAKTITHGEVATYYGTSSFGIVTVESGQNVEFAQFGTNNGVIMDSLFIQGNTVTMNANTIRVLGESVFDRTLFVDGSATYKAPGYSATNLVTTQIYEHGSTNAYNIIELDDTATVELGSQNNIRSTVVFDSDVSNVSCIAVASGETLKLRNCSFKTDGIDADEVIFSAIGSAPVVEVSGCTCNIAHTFAKVFHDTDGTIEGCTLENTVNQPLIKFGDSSATSSVQSGTLEFKQNYLKNATAADTLIEMTGTWYWNKFEYNHAVFSGQTGTGISQAIKISSDQSIGSNTNPMKHWSFSIPSNFGPVRADDRMLRGTHCNLATTNSEVGNYASTNQNQIFSAVNGANRQSMMLGGNQINGELEIEVLKYIAQWDASISGFTFVQNDGETYLTNPTRTLSFVDSVFFAYSPNDTYSVSWVDLDADNPVTVKPIFEYLNGNTPGSASNLTNGGNLPNTPSGIRVFLRVQLPELTSGFKDLVVTNTTQSTVVFSEYWPYKPAMSTDLIPSTDSSFKITGTEAFDATTVFPSQDIAPHTVELRPNKPRYEISIDRSDLSTDDQYHIMFGYQDNDNYYVARFHMLSATTVRCQLWKKVNGTTSQVGTNVNYTVGASSYIPVDFGFTWTPGTNIRWRVDGSDGATEAITDFSDGAVGFETRNCFAKRVAVYETEGFTARNTDLYFSSGHEYTPITNGINLYNCTVNMNAAALFPDLITTEEDTVFEQTTFADASLTNYINGFMELRGMEIQLPGDILLGETGKLHMYGCILYRANNARWKIDTRGISYTDTPPIRIRSCQLRGIYTTILKDGDLTVLDDTSLGSYLIRIYARKEMRVKRNRVLGLDFSRSITDGFQSNEQDVEIHVVNNMVIPGKLDTYWRDQEVFEFISPYCYEWKGKIVAYRTAILEVANVATQVRFTVEEWRDD